MAKRTTTTKKTSKAGGISMPGAQPEVPVEQTAKATEQTTSSRAQTQDVRSSADMVSVTHEMISQRAYEIWRSEGGSETENWLRAERELRTGNEQQGNWQQ